MSATGPSSDQGLAGLFAESQEVSLAYEFGSRARGDEGPLSDYDFAVVLAAWPSSPAARDRLSLRLRRGLATMLGVAPPSVDLVILNRAPIELARAVVAEGRLVYQRDIASRVEFEAGVLGRYGDYLPVLRAQRREILGGSGHEARAKRYGEALGRTRRALGQARTPCD